jgi:hypothetical protein
MIITDKFIYVHQPKTGGSFVVEALFELYGIENLWLDGLPEEFIEPLVYETRQGKFSLQGAKHSYCGDIPENELAKQKTILSNLRSPLDLYVSHYEFGWWKRDDYRPYFDVVIDFEKRFPTFPNITFEEFLVLDYETHNVFFTDGFYGQEGYGMGTVRFVKHFARAQKQLLPKLAATNWRAYDLSADLYPIRFLRTNRLNHDLLDFLLEIGFTNEDVQFIRDKEKVLPLGKGRTKEQKWQKYYTPELLETVLRKDKLLFDLFPEFIPKSL